MNVLNKTTLITLKKNKVRTLVTIIGIILSASMITAVTTCVSSLQSFLVDMTVAMDGDWHGAVYDVDKKQIEGLKSSLEVRSTASVQNIGYAQLKDSQNAYKPYLFVAGMAEKFTHTLPVKLAKGRMPESKVEIILPTHLRTNGGVKYALGDTLRLSIGSRVSDGQVLNQHNPFLNSENGKAEKLSLQKERTYTVVGFYERPGFEDFSAPGYTALTLQDKKLSTSYDIYIKLKKPSAIYSFLETEFPGKSTTTNSSLLRLTGSSGENTYNAVLYSLSGILITIIVFGSISLIYNAFSISVSERTRLFGLLSSIGATKRQMLRSVFFEALFLSSIGIPIGILTGIAGIGLTFKFTESMFLSFLNSRTDAVLHLSVSWEAILAAVLIGLATVLISAYIPARRAFKVSAIDAVRQTGDIKFEAGKVRTSKLTYKLFGFEGMLARKNFKRNKRKYRATVVSLFLSVVLFISASSFCAYIAKSANSVVSKGDYDIVYTFTPDKTEKVTLQGLYKELSRISGVKKAGYAYGQYQAIKLPKKYINKDYFDYYDKIGGAKNNWPDNVDISAVIYFIDSATYKEYLAKNSLDKNIYTDKASPKAIVFDSCKFFNPVEGKYYTFNLFNGQAPHRISYNTVINKEGYNSYTIEIAENGEKSYVYSNDKGQKLKLSEEEATDTVELEIGHKADNKPFCVNNNNSGIIVLYPYDSMPDIIGKSPAETGAALYFNADNHKSVFNEIYNILDEKGLPTDSLIDYAESASSSRAIIAIINIFSYGFIILISLIAAANVFNTISTNIGLRRREFAMLKSIGMTGKGFNKMMNYECLLYGLKGLIYGIPVSVFLTWLIYRSISKGWETGFFIPWYSVTIAVGSVFAVVFSTMLYSMKKIKKDNPIDALKNENL